MNENHLCRTDAASRRRRVAAHQRAPLGIDVQMEVRINTNTASPAIEQHASGDGRRSKVPETGSSENHRTPRTPSASGRA
jgi:hypothetical protein